MNLDSFVRCFTMLFLLHKLWNSGSPSYEYRVTERAQNVVKRLDSVNEATDFVKNSDIHLNETGRFCSSPRLDQIWSPPNHLSSRDRSSPPNVDVNEWGFTSSPPYVFEQY